MNHPLGAFTAQIARKRKEREDFLVHPINGSGNARVKTAQAYPSPSPSPSPSHANTASFKQKPSEPLWSNRLLAGYLAHEFLCQGTLLGEKFDPARAEAVSPTERKKKPDQARTNGGSSAKPAGAAQKKAYAEVARILKTDGAHISGIVNPTQLARWIQM